MKKEQILHLLEEARAIKQEPPGRVLEGKIMASCFFEPSTRTRLSFESAMRRLGGEVIGFSDALHTSSQKGESLYDMMKVIGFYSDVIVLRYPLEGASRQATMATDKPIINAGDGANEHPTQTLLDLFSIQESQGKLEGLKVALVGDLLHGRTVHSLALGLSHFKTRLYFVSPPHFAMPDEICRRLRQSGTPYSFHQSLEEVVPQCDILYMTRVQEERFGPASTIQKGKAPFVLTLNSLQSAKNNLKVLHPLPRVHEIAPEVDASPHAYYFQQAENGLFVRQAILMHLLRKK